MYKKNFNKDTIKIFNKRINEYGCIKIDSDLIDKIGYICGLNAGFLYIKLLKHLNNETGVCDVSIRTIAQDLNVSDKTVSNNLKKLKEAGFIDWEQEKSKYNNYLINHYYFMCPEDIL